MTATTLPHRDQPNQDNHDLPPGDDDFTPPPRRRRSRSRLLTPLTGGVLAVLIAALGFLGGVEVQKATGTSSTSGAGSAPLSAAGQGGLPDFAGGGNSGGANSGTRGTVSYVKHGVIYLKDSDGNTLKVKVSDGTDVTRTAATTAAKVRPGDTVVVQGKTSGSTVTATNVTATATND